ncbi:MAG: hypothetical protein ACTSRW_12250 [Candidatus Helarchaeota archaeon]
MKKLKILSYLYCMNHVDSWNGMQFSLNSQKVLAGLFSSPFTKILMMLAQTYLTE